MREPAAVVAGPRSHAEMLQGGGGAMVGAHCLPGSALALFGVPASLLRDRDVDLTLLWGRPAGELLECAAALPFGTAQLRALSDALRDRARAAPASDDDADLLRWLLAQFELDPGGVRVGDLVLQTGRPWRSIIDLFGERVGLAPKVFQRVCRLQFAVRRLRAADGAAEAAIAAGYADQSHLLREFRALADLTAGAYQRAMPASANHVVVEDGKKVQSNHGPGMPGWGA